MALNKYEAGIILIIDNTIQKLPLHYKNVITHMELLRQVVEWQIKNTPKQLRERKMELHNAQTSVTTIEEEIKRNKKCTISYEYVIKKRIQHCIQTFLDLNNDFHIKTEKQNEMVQICQNEIEKLVSVIDSLNTKHRTELDGKT